MKKLLSFVTLFLISFLLIACDAPVDNSNPAQAIADNIAITFAEGDSLTSVTKNFNVPTAEGDATIAWLSNDTATVSISNGLATVNQPNADKAVKITAIVTLDNKQGTKVFDLNVKAKTPGGGGEEPTETLLYHFTFEPAELNHGYSDSNLTGNLVNQVDSSSFQVGKRRANTAQEGEGLVLSGGSATEATNAYVSFVFAGTITKIEFNARFWADADIANVTTALFQQKVGGNWVTLVDLKSENATAVMEAFEVTELNSNEFRFFVEGSQGTGNTARLVVDDMKVYGTTGSNPDPGPGGGDPEPGTGTLIYSFTFEPAELNHGYSDSNLTGNLLNQVDNSSFQIGKRRANTAQEGEGLVLSGGSATEATNAYVSFVFVGTITKIEFNARFWGDADLANVLSAAFQQKVGGNWVTLVDLKAENATAVMKAFSLTNITSNEFRFYVEGQQGTGNTARLVVDDMKVYGTAGTGGNPDPGPGGGDPDPGEGGNNPQPGVYDNTENFSGASALSTNSSTYSDGTYSAQGITWSWVHAMNATAPADDYTIDGAGVLLRRANEPSSLQGVFPNGLAGFSFEYRKAFTSNAARNYKVDVTVNGQTTTYDLPVFGNTSGADNTVHTFVYSGPVLTGSVTVKIYATGAEGNQQMVIDNFKWSNSDGSVTPGNGGGSTDASSAQDAIDALLADYELTFVSKVADTTIYPQYYAGYTLADYAEAFEVDSVEAYIVTASDDVILLVFVGKTGSTYEVQDAIDLFLDAEEAIQFGSYLFYQNEGALLDMTLIASDAALAADAYNQSFEEPFTTLAELAEYLQISTSSMLVYSTTWGEDGAYPGTDIFVIIKVGIYYIPIEWL